MRKNLCKSVKSVGDSYPKNKYAIVIAAMTPAKSASKPQATAWRVFLMLTLPKYTANI